MESKYASTKLIIIREPKKQVSIISFFLAVFTMVNILDYCILYFVYFLLPIVLNVIPIITVKKALLGVITIIQCISGIQLHSFQLFYACLTDIL